jgi:hypothetical protein
MDLEDDIDDPFKIKDLWQPSRFALPALEPLEPVPLEYTPPGLFILFLPFIPGRSMLTYNMQNSRKAYLILLFMYSTITTRFCTNSMSLALITPSTLHRIPNLATTNP